MTGQGNYWVVVFHDARRGETLSRQFNTREQAMDHACANLYRPSKEEVRALRGPETLWSRYERSNASVPSARKAERRGHGPKELRTQGRGDISSCPRHRQ